MKVNGESIHGTGPSPFAHLTCGKATSKPGKIYLHVFDWPADGSLRIPLANIVKRAYLLADPGTALEVASSKQGTQLKLPVRAPDPIASVIVIEFDGQPQVTDN
jgi:alpha-L-fucosidase